MCVILMFSYSSIVKIDFNVVYPCQRMTKIYWISSRRVATTEERNCPGVDVVLLLITV